MHTCAVELCRNFSTSITANSSKRLNIAVAIFQKEIRTSYRFRSIKHVLWSISVLAISYNLIIWWTHQLKILNFDDKCSLRESCKTLWNKINSILYFLNDLLIYTRLRSRIKTKHVNYLSHCLPDWNRFCSNILQKSHNNKELDLSRGLSKSTRRCWT